MAKPKKRIPTRKKSSKRGKASAKPSRKKAATRSPLKSKSKVQRARSAPKPAAKKKQPLKTARRTTPSKTPQVMEAPVETTIIDVVEEPVPGLVVVTEYELVRTVIPGQPSGGAGPGTDKQ